MIRYFAIHSNIWRPNPNPKPSDSLIQDAILTLILTISLHFIEDSFHLKDKNVELLSNIKCKKLSDFYWYKNTFLTRVMLREDSNQLFWKEKFLVALPTLEKRVRNKIKDIFGTKTILYNQLILFQTKFISIGFLRQS
jgi:hypothetical protein